MWKGGGGNVRGSHREPFSRGWQPAADHAVATGDPAILKSQAWGRGFARGGRLVGRRCAAAIPWAGRGGGLRQERQKTEKFSQRSDGPAVTIVEFLRAARIGIWKKARKTTLDGVGSMPMGELRRLARNVQIDPLAAPRAVSLHSLRQIVDFARHGEKAPLDRRSADAGRHSFTRCSQKAADGDRFVGTAA